MSDARTRTSGARRRRRRRRQRRPLPQRGDPQGSARPPAPSTAPSWSAPFVRKALAMSGGGDVGILNFALTLEYLESSFYEEAKTRAEASGELKSLIDLLGRRRAAARRSADGDDQEARRQAGRGAEIRLPLRRHGRLPRSWRRPSRTPGSAPTTAPAPAIKSKEVLGAAGSIVQVEARHAAAIRLQNMRRAVPGGLRPRARRSAGAEGRRTVYRLEADGARADDGSR